MQPYYFKTEITMYICSNLYQEQEIKMTTPSSYVIVTVDIIGLFLTKIGHFLKHKKVISPFQSTLIHAISMN